MSIGAAVRGNAFFQLFTIEYDVSSGLACMAFVMLRHVPSYAHLPGVVFLII